MEQFRKTFQEVQYRGSTGELSYVPYLAMCVNCFLWSLYGIYKDDIMIVSTNVFGEAFGVWYMYVFLSNCPLELQVIS